MVVGWLCALTWLQKRGDILSLFQISKDFLMGFTYRLQRNFCSRMSISIKSDSIFPSWLDGGAGIVVKCRYEDIVSFFLVNLHFHHYNEPTGDMVVWSLCGLIRLQQRGDTLKFFQISNDFLMGYTYGLRHHVCSRLSIPKESNSIFPSWLGGDAAIVISEKGRLHDIIIFILVNFPFHH